MSTRLLLPLALLLGASAAAPCGYQQYVVSNLQAAQYWPLSEVVDVGSTLPNLGRASRAAMVLDRDVLLDGRGALVINLPGSTIATGGSLPMSPTSFSVTAWFLFPDQLPISYSRVLSGRESDGGDFAWWMHAMDNGGTTWGASFFRSTSWTRFNGGPDVERQVWTMVTFQSSRSTRQGFVNSVPIGSSSSSMATSANVIELGPSFVYIRDLSMHSQPLSEGQLRDLYEQRTFGDSDCACFPGWRGSRCAERCSSVSACYDCSSQPGICVNGECHGESCACDEGWAGLRCDNCAPGYFGSNCRRCESVCSSGESCGGSMKLGDACYCEYTRLAIAAGPAAYWTLASQQADAVVDKLVPSSLSLQFAAGGGIVHPFATRLSSWDVDAYTVTGTLPSFPADTPFTAFMWVLLDGLTSRCNLVRRSHTSTGPNTWVLGWESTVWRFYWLSSSTYSNMHFGSLSAIGQWAMIGVSLFRRSAAFVDNDAFTVFDIPSSVTVDGGRLAVEGISAYVRDLVVYTTPLGQQAMLDMYEARRIALSDCATNPSACCSCFNGYGGDHCMQRCLPGLYGMLCDSTCPSGRLDPCSGHGSCSDGFNGTGLCTCDPRFIEKDCSDCLAGHYGQQCSPCTRRCDTGFTCGGAPTLADSCLPIYGSKVGAMQPVGYWQLATDGDSVIGGPSLEALGGAFSGQGVRLERGTVVSSPSPRWTPLPDMTVEVWLVTGQLSDDAVTVARHGMSGGAGWLIQAYSSRSRVELQVVFGDGASPPTVLTSTVIAGEWQYIVFRRTAGRAELNIGLTVTTSEEDTVLSSPNSQLVLGNSSAAGEITVRDLAIYDFSISDEAIRKHFDAQMATLACESGEAGCCAGFPGWTGPGCSSQSTPPSAARASSSYVAVVAGALGAAFLIDVIGQLVGTKKHRAACEAAKAAGQKMPKQRRIRRWKLFGAGVAVFDFLTDVYFVLEMSASSPLRVPALFFLVFPVTVNTLAVVAVVSRSMKRKQLHDWARKYINGLAFVLVLSCMNPNCLSVLTCNLYGLQLFHAPLLRVDEDRITLLSTTNALLEDLPQIVIQILALQSESAVPAPVALLALTTSMCTLAYGLLRRLVLFLLLKGPADAEAGNGVEFPMVRTHTVENPLHRAIGGSGVKVMLDLGQARLQQQALPQL